MVALNGNLNLSYNVGVCVYYQRYCFVMDFVVSVGQFFVWRFAVIWLLVLSLYQQFFPFGTTIIGLLFLWTLSDFGIAGVFMAASWFGEDCQTHKHGGDWFIWTDHNENSKGRRLKLFLPAHE